MGKKSKKKKVKEKKRAAKRLQMQTITSESMAQVKSDELLVNLTLEPFQLARLYYLLNDHQEIPRIFSQMRCMDYDETEDCWLWLYHGEAKKLKFKRSYRDIPKDLRPTVLGTFHSDSYNHMYLNITSVDRARQAVSFFTEYLPDTVAEVTEIAVLKKLFNRNDEKKPEHNDYFGQDADSKEGSETIIRNNLADILGAIADPRKKMEAVLSQMEKIEKKTMIANVI